MKRPREKEFFSNDGRITGRMTFFYRARLVWSLFTFVVFEGSHFEHNFKANWFIVQLPPVVKQFFLSGPSNDCRQEVKVLKENADDDILMWVLHCTNGTVCLMSLYRLDSMKMCPSSCWVSHKTIEVQSTRGQNHKALREEGRRLMFPMSVFKWFYGNSKPLKFPSMASRVARNY